MNTATKILLGLGALAAVAAGGWFWTRAAKGNKKAIAKPQEATPTVSISIADVLNLPKVDFVPTKLDLSRFEKDSSWRYHGTVVI